MNTRTLHVACILATCIIIVIPMAFLTYLADRISKHGPIGFRTQLLPLASSLLFVLIVGLHRLMIGPRIQFVLQKYLAIDIKEPGDTFLLYFFSSISCSVLNIVGLFKWGDWWFDWLRSL